MKNLLKFVVSTSTIFMVAFSPFISLSPTVLAVTPTPSWPSSWNLLNSDSATDCNQTQGNVLNTYYFSDGSYLYLRMNTEGNPNVNDTLYKWFLDSGNDAYSNGTSIFNYENLVIAHDGKVYLCSPSADKLNQCTEITDTNKLNYRVDGNNLDMSISLNDYGPIKSVWWITDKSDKNLNQQPNGKNTDWPDSGAGDIPFTPIDYCPNDPNKTEPGICGCGTPDIDGDGDGYLICQDCNDANSNINPGAIEVCDGIDNDCDGLIDEILAEPTTCGIGTCFSTGQLICAYGNLTNTCQPGTPVAEICDNLDNNCDGSIDENLTQPTYCGQGVCSANTGIETCAMGVWGGDTCDPFQGSTQEVCDEGLLDEDCDGSMNEGCSICIDGATLSCGQTDVGECSKGIQTCSNGTWGDCVGAVNPTDEVCDGLDNDCNGASDEDFVNLGQTCEAGEGICQNSGVYVCSQDGLSSQCNATPGAPSTEVCDGLDNDCDGTTDEDAIDAGTWYRDSDSDNYGDPQTSQNSCTQPDGYVENNTDCNDEDSSVNPGAIEICDGIDNNCDGTIDDGCECTNETTQQCGPQTDVGECVFGTQTCTNGIWGQCTGAIGPTTEVCDNLDNNCDGQVDEGDVCVVPPTTETICNDLIDNDNDTLVDCADQDCADDPACQSECVSQSSVETGYCTDGVDNDCDGAIDGQDSDCGPAPECTSQATLTCSTGLLGICSAGTQTCNATSSWGSCIQANTPTTENCSNGLDDDCDGTVDNSDTDCYVPISGGGGGGGGGGPIFLNIFNETNGDITSVTAVVGWFTNILATSRVVYDIVPHYYDFGTAPNYGYAFSTPEDSNKVTFHTVVITGLTPGITYYWRAISHGSGEIWGQELVFTTIVLSQPLPPGEETSGGVAPETGGTGVEGGTGAGTETSGTAGETGVTGGTGEETQPSLETGTSGATGEEKGEEAAVGTNAFLAAIGGFFNLKNIGFLLIILAVILIFLFFVFKKRKKKKEQI